jgi:hypothetical protein
MARYKKNDDKINTNTRKVPQEVEKEDNSRTLKSVAPKDIQHRWHQSVHDLPPGQIIDIIRPHTSTILQVTPEALHKFHRQTQLMTRQVPIQPQTSTIHQVTPEALPKFHFFRLRWRRCPNSTGERNQ